MIMLGYLRRINFIALQYLLCGAGAGTGAGGKRIFFIRTSCCGVGPITEFQSFVSRIFGK